MPKRFTLHEAEELLPRLTRLLEEAAAFQQAYRNSDRALRSTRQRVMFAGGAVVDRSAMLDSKRRMDEAAASLRRALAAIEGFGCQLKDLDQGLIDFPCLYRGAEACLCWKLGEPRIQFWHNLEAGFAGRQPIDRDFIEGHSGDPLH